MSETKRYWFNTRTHEVEDGPQSLATDRIGPFATEEEARNALEIVRRRSAEWAAEEDAERDQ
ncbi:hypothetical protein [Pseudoclavibacter soli]|jgi:hypothetical protein|uniref:hypothetical protein n=1 Tax=Pseudoclavibacter soli TaxID=452623 RepID=UPI000409DDF8|nr:hypothetical protein [Pseudoclavibacter soli]